MTIIEVAQELQKDGTKKFTRPSWRGWKMGHIDGDLFDISPVAEGISGLSLAHVELQDILATDWEEVK